MQTNKALVKKFWRKFFWTWMNFLFEYKVRWNDEELFFFYKYGWSSWAYIIFSHQPQLPNKEKWQIMGPGRLYHVTWQWQISIFSLQPRIGLIGLLNAGQTLITSIEVWIPPLALLFHVWQVHCHGKKLPQKTCMYFLAHFRTFP